jgi:hypothetical protein
MELNQTPPEESTVILKFPEILGFVLITEKDVL